MYILFFRKMLIEFKMLKCFEKNDLEATFMQFDLLMCLYCCYTEMLHVPFVQIINIQTVFKSLFAHSKTCIIQTN